jgi:hypothetical protein
MPSVQSRINGLIIDVPADARGVLRRFTSKGDNELVFAGIKGLKANEPEEKLVIESEPEKAPPASTGLA